MRKTKLLAALTIAISLHGEQPDATVLQRIREAELSNSEVMDHAFWLSEVYGPRLTGSPNFRAASTWVETRLRGYGLQVHEEPFNQFGNGWWCDHFEMSLLTPTFAPLMAAPVAWSNATTGRVVGEVVRVNMPKSPSEFDSFVAKYHGKIRNTLFLVEPARPLPFQSRLSGKRLSDQDLAELSSDQQQSTNPGPKPAASPGSGRPAPKNWQSLLMKFMHDEGVLAMVSPGPFLNDGGVFTVTAAGFGPGDVPPDVPPMIVMAREHYDRLARLVDHGIKTTVALESSTHFLKDTPYALNIIGEIRGGQKPNEIVMIGAHLDSWTSGTGATDDAAGCAIIIEAFRLLESLGVKMDRTVRLALWGGEEQGLRGSSAYVHKHFGDEPTGQRAPEYSELSAYFNLDSGTGKIRGIYSEGNEAVRPIFSEMMAPLRDLGAATVSPQMTTGGDHVPFSAAGLPAYAFIQDPLDYSSRTHHTNMDVYDRLQPEDLTQAVAVVATLLYEAANREQMLPRRSASTLAPTGIGQKEDHSR